MRLEKIWGKSARGSWGAWELSGVSQTWDEGGTWAWLWFGGHLRKAAGRRTRGARPGSRGGREGPGDARR